MVKYWYSFKMWDGIKCLLFSMLPGLGMFTPRSSLQLRSLRVMQVQLESVSAGRERRNVWCELACVIFLPLRAESWDKQSLEEGPLCVPCHDLPGFMGDPCAVLEKPPRMGGMEKRAQCWVLLQCQLHCACPRDVEVSLPALPLPLFRWAGGALFSPAFGLGILALPMAFMGVTGWLESHVGR